MGLVNINILYSYIMCLLLYSIVSSGWLMLRKRLVNLAARPVSFTNINHYIIIFIGESAFTCISFSAVATLIFFVKRHKT